MEARIKLVGLVLVAVLGLVGCAKSPAQQLAERGYAVTAEEFVMAAKRNDATAVGLFIDARQDPNQFHDGEPVLFHVVRARAINALRVLAQRGVNLNITCERQGITALFIPTRNNDLELVEILLDAGADSNVKSVHEGVTPLMMASAMRHTSVASLLLERGAAVDAQCLNGKTALMYAAESGNSRSDVNEFNVASLLIGHGASPDLQCLNGMTALMYAAESGSRQCFKALLSAGADFGLKCARGRTALEYAHGNGFAYIALSSRGASYGQPNRQPWLNVTRLANTFLHAVAAGDTQQVALLIGNGMYPDVDDGGGRSALTLAAGKGDMAMVELLIRSGAGVDGGPPGHHWEIPLAAAARAGRIDIVDYLLDSGADINHAWLGALQAAVGMNNLAMAAHLISKGSAVDDPEASGATPLMMASHQGSVEIVRLLLGKGADVNRTGLVNLQDMQGWRNYSALALAQIEGHEEIVGILKAAGAR